MTFHQDKYDDKLMRERSELAGDLPPGSATSKVGTGEVGAHRQELSEPFIDALDATRRDTITADLGIPSYEALLEMLTFHG